METIGRYRLDRRLGAGSFATVWLGHDDDLDVPVAVKVLAENWAANEDVRNRFLAEARILRRIHDRRIVQVYDIGTLPDSRPYFVMDFINGGSMDDLRKRGVAPVRALRLCAEACRALDVLHTNNVIHRDVTPGNLLLNTTPDGQTQVLLADLGVAKSMADVAGATMTAGTPSYMAPEQATGGALDRRADIYSLTALTYAMLTGKPPFAVRNVSDIFTRDAAVAPGPIAAALGAPASLDAVMQSGLATSPNRRPPTALILGQALDVIADQMSKGRSEEEGRLTLLATTHEPTPEATTTPMPAESVTLAESSSPLPTAAQTFRASATHPASVRAYPPRTYPPEQPWSQSSPPSASPTQWYPDQSYPGQSYPGQSYPGQSYGGEAYPDHPGGPGAVPPYDATPLSYPSLEQLPGASAASSTTSPYLQPTYSTPTPDDGAGSYLQPYAEPSVDDRPRRRVSFVILLVVAAIAIFMLSLFVTIVVLQH